MGVVSMFTPPPIAGGTGNNIKTKICCTIGPASASAECIKSLISAGMSIARLNLSHASHAFAQKVILTIREVEHELDLPTHVAIWIDVNGPKIRSGRLADEYGGTVELCKGEPFAFYPDPNLLGDNTKIAANFPQCLIQVGDRIFIDDGILSFTVTQHNGDHLMTVVDNSGVLGENKGVSFPLRIVDRLPTISEKDRKDILFALEQNVDFISVGCIRSIEDVEEMRILLGNSKIKLVAKIENRAGLDNFTSILKMADAIVIDRGYLGAEVESEVIAIAQKRMVAYCNTAGKPVLVANQMLESMRTHPRPTRSESADVANAVIDGADALVLSSETAIGEFVVESLQTMLRIAREAEQYRDYRDYLFKMIRSVPKPINVSESIASSAVLAATQINAGLIIVITELGGTARLVAKYRPEIPVIVATLIAKTARQLSINFGLVPYYHAGNPATVIMDTMRRAVRLRLCSPGQRAVVTSGQAIGFLEGTTTTMQIIPIPNFD